jgi:hypothetical protein
MATWPSRLAEADLADPVTVAAAAIAAIAVVIVMHPDILSAQGPQYVSPARRLLTVVVAFFLAFLLVWGVVKIDGWLSVDVRTSDPDLVRRKLVGLALLAALLFGGIWSFIGPKDFGRRIPLRVSHGALGGIALWAAISLATLLALPAYEFLSGSLDSYYTLLAVDAANGRPGATVGWAVFADVLTAAAAMGLAGALLVTTAPQTLGNRNRRGSALVAGGLLLVLFVVALSTWGTTRSRQNEITADVMRELGLSSASPPRAAILLAAPETPPRRRVVAGNITIPQATADDCVHRGDENRVLPAASLLNVQKLTGWLEGHRDEVNGLAVRVASCRVALLSLRWEPEAAREAVFLGDRPERIGALTYLYATEGVATGRPASAARILSALADTARFQQGLGAASRLAALARVAGDTAQEARWRALEVEPLSAAEMSTLRARPAYTDGVVQGRVASAGPLWRVGLLLAGAPGTGAGARQAPGWSEGTVLTAMVAATDAAADGSFRLAGLRDGYYQLALLGPEGTSWSSFGRLTVHNDPGVFALEPGRKTKDLGTITLTY